MSADSDGRDAHRTRLVIITGFALLVLGLVAVAVVTAARSENIPQPAITASPVPSPGS